MLKLYLVRDGALAWYSVKIRAISTVRFERRKADEKANQYKNWNIQTLLQSLLSIYAKCHRKSIPFQSWCTFSAANRVQRRHGSEHCVRERNAIESLDKRRLRWAAEL